MLVSERVWLVASRCTALQLGDEAETVGEARRQQLQPFDNGETSQEAWTGALKGK